MKQFKEGDWVRIKDKNFNAIFQIDLIDEFGNLFDENQNYKGEQKYWELWQPKENEYCCFHNGTEQFTVAKFQNHTDNTATRFKLVSCYGKWTEIFKYCAPFIGELPSFLKVVI